MSIIPNNSSTTIKLGLRPYICSMKIYEMATPLTINFQYKPLSKVEIIWSFETNSCNKRKINPKKLIITEKGHEIFYNKFIYMTINAEDK